MVLTQEGTVPPIHVKKTTNIQTGKIKKYFIRYKILTGRK